MRYKVSTVDGYLNPQEGREGRGPGLSAHVLDTLNCHRVVGTFRSETRYPRLGGPITFPSGPAQGREAAVRAAERLADFLNAHDA